MSTVLTPSTRSQRDRLVRLGVMIFVASLPIAAILLALVNWQVAAGFVLVWTVGLLFGVGQQRTISLKIDANGLQYEAGTFVLRAAWADLDRIGEATLPSGKTQAIVLRKGAGEAIAGFAGLWLMVDEAHVVTVAVLPEAEEIDIEIKESDLRTAHITCFRVEQIMEGRSRRELICPPVVVV